MQMGPLEGPTSQLPPQFTLYVGKVVHFQLFRKVANFIIFRKIIKRHNEQPRKPAFSIGNTVSFT